MTAGLARISREGTEGAGALRPGRAALRLLLAGVGLVVVLVTIPLLRSLALRENERDALRALELLAPVALAPGAATFSELFQPDGELARRLPDTRLLDAGRVLFHHGYLFEVVDGPGGAPQLRAWPLRHGETGLGVFWSPRPGELHGHPNRGARWSGLEAAPPVPPGPGSVELSAGPSGWRPLPAALALR